MSSDLLLAFYGDDFTGSTDALEFLCRAGAKTMLFIDPPTVEQLNKYPDLQAIGVAGKTRSMSPVAMEEVLFPAFQQLQQLKPRHVHYKVCSTFDSSPTIGSIGKAIETGAAVFNNKFIPLLVAAPSLCRYCLFGNLFAKMGLGSDGKIFRLDRHPSMSKHPVTPATESDLRLHAAKQTAMQINLLDILQLGRSQNELREIIDGFTADNKSIVLIDALYETHLQPIGELMDTYAQQETLFSAGSSGIEMALGNYWNTQGILKTKSEWNEPGKADPLLVISGSCSPVTSEQIAWARINGFEEIVIDIHTTPGSTEIKNKMETSCFETISYLKKGKSVIVHTGQKLAENLSAETTGTALGLIAKEAVKQANIKRLVISGGDTSSYAARALAIEAVTMIAPLVAGAPLCKAISVDKTIDGLEVNFKGGQVGAADYFGVLREGRI